MMRTSVSAVFLLFLLAVVIAAGGIRPVTAAASSGSISVLVWHDANRNGIQEPNEAGWSAVPVQVWGPNFVRESLTDSDGTAVFTVADGHYLVCLAIVPLGYTVTNPGPDVNRCKGVDVSDVGIGQPVEFGLAPAPIYLPILSAGG